MITYPNVKINLGLNVLRKRQDGYHDIESLFFPCSQIHDCLEIVSGDDYSRTSARLAALYGGIDTQSDAPAIAQGISDDGKLMITIARQAGVDWNPLSDLCAKAYAMLDADFHLPPVKIFLEKTSPVGAGLGGGSSDAAYTLKMLSEMFSLDLDTETIAGYAARLGSDCAFFAYNRPMVGRGRGEVLTPFDLPVNVIEDESEATYGDKASLVLKIIVPEGIHVSTAEAYKGIVPAIPGITLEDAIAHPIEDWKDLLHNDFEETVFKVHPELTAIKQSLYDSGAVYASMSGSGSALFGLYSVR